MRGQKITKGEGAAIAAFTIFTNAYSFLPAGFSGRDVWLSHIISGIVFFFSVWFLVSLCEKYPDESFFGILEGLTGKVLGKVIAILLGFLSLLTLTVSLTVFSRFVQITALPQTPQIIIPFLITICAALSLRSSLRSASGTARLLIWFFMAVFIFFVIGGIREVRLSLLFGVPEKLSRIFRGSGEVYLNRFATAFALMAVYTRIEKKKEKKKWFLGSVAISSLALGIISVITVATLGQESISRDFYSVFTAMSIRGVGGFIRHTEILACIVMTISLFFKSVVCILFSDDMVSGICKSEKGVSAYLPIGLLVTAFTQIIYRDTSALRGLLQWKSGAGFVLALHVLIPIMLFLLGKIRKKKEG